MTSLFHITHLNNLVSIMEDGGLLCDSLLGEIKKSPFNIAFGHIKNRRARKAVSVASKGTLADYVPFYFAPRSPMLYTIHKGNVAKYQGGQETILHLVITIEEIVQSKIPYTFTDGHAVMEISRFFDDLKYLDQVDWEVMQSRYWSDTRDDNDRRRRRQAEFLVYQFVPWNKIIEIGVMSHPMKAEVSKLISNQKHQPVVNLHPEWYY